MNSLHSRCEKCNIEFKTNEAYLQCSCLFNCSIDDCKWKGLTFEFVFGLCPNHRVLHFNEDTYGCFICVECRKYYRPKNQETYDDWRCNVCSSECDDSKSSTHKE
jgi:hypothetical protein